VACRSEVVTDEGAFHKFISIAHCAGLEHLACPLTLSLRQATSCVIEAHSSSVVKGDGFTNELSLSQGKFNPMSRQGCLIVRNAIAAVRDGRVE
jgi:hypothetical protein